MAGLLRWNEQTRSYKQEQTAIRTMLFSAKATNLKDIVIVPHASSLVCPLEGVRRHF